MSLVFGLLLESVTTNLSDIGRARLEAHATELAEQRARELEIEIADGKPFEIGVTEGAYEEPDDELRWHITVSEHTLDLPADYPGKEPPSALFARPGAAPAPVAAGETPPLLVVEVRVLPLDAAPESADPFVLLVTAADPARAQRLQQERLRLHPQQPADPPR